MSPIFCTSLYFSKCVGIYLNILSLFSFSVLINSCYVRFNFSFVCDSFSFSFFFLVLIVQVWYVAAMVSILAALRKFLLCNANINNKKRASLQMQCIIKFFFSFFLNLEL